MSNDILLRLLSLKLVRKKDIYLSRLADNSLLNLYIIQFVYQ